MKNMVFAQIRDAQARLESSEARYRLLSETTVPTEKEAVDAALAGYKGGTVDFLMLIENQKMYFMSQVDAEMAVMNCLQAEALLERAIGIPLERVAK